MKRKILSLVVLSIALTGCEQEKISDTLDVGKITVTQMKSVYPNATAFSGIECGMGMGDRDITERSVKCYRNTQIIQSAKNKLKIQMTETMVFDRNSQILQMLNLRYTDNSIVSELEKKLKAADFEPYPELTPDDFEILKTSQNLTPEQRKQTIEKMGVKEFKKDRIFVQLFPQMIHQGRKTPYAEMFIVNLDYEPEHRAHWEKEQAKK